MAGMIKWNPFGDMTKFFEQLNKLFEEYWSSFPADPYSVQLVGNKLNIQVRDEGQELVIVGEIPGVNGDQLDVALHQDHVVICGENTTKTERDGMGKLHWYRFTKVQPLPARVKSEQAAIDFKDGRLVIRAPKL